MRDDFELVRGDKPAYHSASIKLDDCVETAVLCPESFGEVFTPLRYADVRKMPTDGNGIRLRDYDIVIATHYGRTAKVEPKVTMIVGAGYASVTPHYKCVVLRTHAEAKMYQVAWLKFLCGPAGRNAMLDCMEKNILSVKKLKEVLRTVQLYYHSEELFDEAVTYAITAAMMKHEACHKFRWSDCAVGRCRMEKLA